MAIRCLNCMKEYAEGVSKCPHCGYIEGADEDSKCYLPPRTVLKGRYMIGCCLGSGGFGVTYVAWDSLLEKKVAIKEYLPSELATRTIGETRVTIHDVDCAEKYQQGKRSFIEESRRLAKFNSVKGVVSIFDCFDENDTAYLVMECLEGKTLQQMIDERKKIPFKEVLPIFVDILEALEVVHAAGMMHRDIAPDNIFVCNDGTAKLIDFGAARFMTTTHSRSLSMILKIGYAPIEQYTKHGNQGPWTDIYAVAASLYHALTGVVPPDSYDRVEEDKLKRPSLMARHLPAHAETAILNALNIIETNRTSSAKQFAEELSGDIDVARIREKIKHEDTGRIAKWMKYAAAAFAAAIVAFAVLYVSTGGALFRSSDYDVPEGMTRVPYVLNEVVSDADVKLNESTLHMVIGERITDAYFNNNFVLQQNPRSGNVAYNGSVVTVTASMKPDEYYIPDLSDYTKEAAVELLEAAGFVVLTESGESRTTAPGAVISQSPAGNSIVYEGSEVTLVINSSQTDSSFSTGRLADVPDFVGKQFDKAHGEAIDRKLYIAISRGEYSDDIPAGQIIEQSPEGGRELYEGSTVYVTVSLGKKTIIVPNVVYMSEEEAAERIESRLLVPTVKYVEDKNVQEGLVIAQLPLYGKTIYEGGEVTIYVSTGIKMVVPDVVGKTQEEAQSTLIANSLGYAVTMQNSETVPAGTVISQSIEAGESVLQGTVVNLVVSAGSAVVHVTGVTINTSSLTLEYGEIYTFVASVLPKNATTTTVYWSSSDSSVVSIDGAGVATAVGVGTATISVTTTDGGHVATCTVNVKKLLDSLTVTSRPGKAWYYLGDSADYSGLVLTAKYSDGSSENVAGSASLTGFDSATSGKKTIVCQYTYDGVTKSASFDVNVRELTSITVTPPSKTSYSIGDSLSTGGMVVTANYNDATSRDVTGAGSITVTGFSSVRSGECQIQVTYTEGTTKMASFAVTVIGDLVIAPDTVTLDNGASYTFTAAYASEAGADLSSLKWTSSKPDIVSVSGNGNTCTVTALGAGSVSIIATDKYGTVATAIVNAYGAVVTSTERPDESLYEIVDTWTEYRSRTRSKSTTTTSSTSGTYDQQMSGWTRYHTDDVSYWSAYGATQGPVDSNPGASDYRKVWSDTVKTADAWEEITGYSYYYYTNVWSDGSTSGSTVHSCYLSSSTTKIVYYNTTVSGRLKSTGRTSTCNCGISGTIYNATGVYNKNTRWYFGDTPIVVEHPATYKTVFYYQDRSWVSQYNHYFYKWNDWSGWDGWSDWSRNAVSAGTSTSGSVPYQSQTETGVETRTCYSYRLKPTA